MDLSGGDLPERCPVCHKDISSYTDEHKRKHIDRCRRTKPKYLYSDLPRGRPSKRKPIKTPCKMALIVGIIVTLALLADLVLHIS